ncbi:hypothetical protein G6F18_011812 [Rhizopus arrhizus]|nr:hypothetical protein G6F19_011850 [Rhizopus arrhizus]KAG0822320.1 hypothetical protein G6F18_011812 [Rhizopus arrhizus]
MTAVRGPYNKSSQRIPLTDDQLETLAKGFIEHRKTVPCPHCKIPTVFRTKGKSKATNHKKEHEYLCTVCSRIMHADDMLALVTRRYDMEEDSQPQVTSSQPQLPSPFPPQLEMGATPDMQTLLQTLMTLTTELQQARTEIANLNEQLNSKQQHQPPPVSPITLEDDFPALPVSKYQSAPWHQPQKVLSLAQIVSKNQEKREATAARSYSLGKLRTTFKKLGVNNGRLLDLHYPDRNIVAVLVHNDYAPELTELLTKKGVKLNNTFDPCAASVLKDPKYATETLEQREQTVQQLHNQRVQKALVHIRGPAKFTVARFFAHKSWITKTQLDEVLATDPYFAHSKDPDAEDIFVTKDNASVGSAKFSMEKDDPLTTSSQ